MGTKRNGSSSLRRVTVVLGVLALGVAALFVFGYRQYLSRQHVVEAVAHKAQGTLPVVNVEQVRRAPATSDLVLPGNTTPVTEAYIYARASGYVKRRLVDIGDRVKEGQLLAEIDAPDLDQQVAQARASVAQAEKQLDQAKADLVDAQTKEELARVTWERYKVLVDHGAVSKQDGDQQQAAYRSSVAAVNSVEARIGSADQNVKASRANLDRLISMQDFEKVRAPFAGVITVRNFDIGALISGTGASLGQNPGGGPTTGTQGGELFRVAQIGVLRVLVNVPENDTPSIRVGQPATVLVQAYPNRKFEGRITRNANSVDLNSRTMLTEVQVSNPAQLLLPGMFVQVRLENARAEPPLLIPGDSVISNAKGLQVATLQDLRPEDAKGRTYPAEARRIHLQQIQAGRDYGQQMEVISGLQGWEYVVLNPGDETEEGAIVLPIAAPKPEGAGGPRRRNAPGR